jgi:hypothetical protein
MEVFMGVTLCRTGTYVWLPSFRWIVMHLEDKKYHHLSIGISAASMETMTMPFDTARAKTGNGV